MSGEGVHNPIDLTDVEDQLDDIEAALVIIDDEIENLDADLVLVQADVTDILAVTNALPTLSETGGTVTTDGTEQNVYINANPLGEYNPICVTINCTAQTATETIVLRLYYDNAPGGAGLILVDELEFAGAIDHPMIVIDLDPNRYGVAVTIEKTGGTNRAYPWDVHYEI